MDILLVTSETSAQAVAGSLDLLSHTISLAPVDVDALVHSDFGDVIIVDARNDLIASRTFTRLLRSTENTRPVVLVITQSNLVALHNDWGIDDFVLPEATPAELETRLRLVSTRQVPQTAEENNGNIVIGGLVVDENNYTARLHGDPLDLTYKEFELLKYLVHNVGRVFSRAQLLQEVWGYGFFGGSRTVDVHVRRLRAKLGPDYESLISTVRNVGYKAVSPLEKNTDPVTSPTVAKSQQE